MKLPRQRHRAPAMQVFLPKLEPDAPFVTVARHAATDVHANVHVDRYEELHPAVEQPRLDYQSGRQPYVVWGFRRYVRTGMAAADPFQGRWAYVGKLLNTYKDRYRMTTGQGRTGVAFVYPQFGTKPLRVPLGRATVGPGGR